MHAAPPVAVLRAELVRETGLLGQVGDGLAVVAAAHRGAALAGAARHHDLDARLDGARPDRGLAQAGAAGDGHARGIHVGILLEIVHQAADAQRPGADGAPVVVGAGRARRVVQAAQAEFIVILEIRGDVGVAERGEAETLLEIFLDRGIHAETHAARHLHRRDFEEGLGPGIPAVTRLHARVADHHVVLGEAEVQQDRGRSDRILGQVQEHVHARAVVVRGEIQGDLLADGRAVETEVLLHVVAQRGLLGRPLAVLVLLEELDDLGPAFLPLPGILHGFAVVEGQRIRQAELVVAHLGFIVIDGNARDHVAVLCGNRCRAKQRAA